MQSNSRLEHLSNWLHQRSQWWLLAVIFFFLYDIALDISAGEVDTHLLVEALIFLICTGVLFVEWRRSKRLSTHLTAAQAHNQRLSGQFSDYVRASFVRWNLSRSEQEVAWLVLKGFSFGEIAALRTVQEKTVRQQATAIYAKSGCGNRNGFIAHFIQDLLTGDVVSGELPDSAASPAAPALTSASGRAQE